MTNIIKLDKINSTNTYARSALLEGALDLPCAVIASEQSCGRGRYGRDFYSPAGSGIYLSYVFEGSYELEAMLQLTVIAAALVHEVLQDHCEDELAISWINDIYRGKYKVAGILTERVDDPDCSGRYYIIVGIGVNVLPSEVPCDLASVMGFLCDEGSADLIPQITEDIIASLDETLADCDVSEFPALVDYYRRKCRDLSFDFGDELLNQ